MLHIGLGFDANYAPHARTFIRSIIDHTTEDMLHFWVLVDEDVSAATCRAITAETGERASVRFLESPHPTNSLPLNGSRLTRHISKSMYLRLFLCDLIDPDVERIIYVDSDMLCMSSLFPLRDIDLKGMTVGAVRDAYTRRLNDGGGIPGLREHSDIDPQDPYFNSGMLVIDTDRWRRQDVTRRCLEYLDRYAHESRYPDQDALNFVLYGAWFRIPRAWNYMMGWRLEPAYGGDPSTAALVHCVGPTKFWDPDFPEFSEFKARYWRYRHDLMDVS